MHMTNKKFDEIVDAEMIEFANLVMKYSPSQFIAMVTAVDLDNLQYDMERNGATREELRASSECHHDIWQLMRMCGIEN